MKQRVQGLTAIVAAIVIGSLGVVFALNHVRAAGASIYFSPASHSVAQGATTTFTVRANTGGANIDVAGLAITYDTAALEFVGASAASSPISNPAGSGAAYKNNGGTISGAYFTTTPVSGDIVLVTITFKARVSSGSASLQFSNPGANGTIIAGGGTDLGASLGSATVALTPPPATPAPSTPSSSPDKPTSNNSAPHNSSSGGSTSGYTATDTPAGTDPTARTPPQPGGESTALAGSVIPELKIGVFDKKNKPIKNKEVTLRSEPQTVKTDGDGFAIFKHVPIGNHTLSYRQGDTVHEMPIYVANGDVQTVVFDFAQRNLIIMWTILTALALSVAALVTVLVRRSGGFNFPSIKRRNPPSQPGPLGPNGATNFAPPTMHHKHSSTPGMIVGTPDGVKTFPEDK